jgi:tripartite-type tricarboxylate transporter receptor subunit TctC
MKFPRRHFLHLAAGAAALSATPGAARALEYPTRPVQVLVGFTPAGAQDICARLMGQWLSERLGQQFIVENRPGAGSNIATEAVARAPADGYTLLQVGPPVAFNATLYDKLNFNFLRDITPVAGIMRAPNVLVVNLEIPTQTVPEFIAYAKANPGKISMATGGNGTTQHIFGELFNMMAGTKLIPVAYRGGAPALLDLLAGHVQVEFAPLAEAIGYIRAGKLHALAITAAMRSTALPDLPTVGEFLPGYEATAWYGICAPTSTPTDIVDKLNREINAGLADGMIREKLADLGGAPLPLTAAEFGKLITDETQKWGKVIRAANIRAE